MSNELANITLICWSCGKKKHLGVSQKPQWGFELAQIANQAGWIGATDYSKVLVFCSQECMKKQTKKDGTLRKYPKRDKK